MDCIVQGVAKSRTQRSDFHFHFLFPFQSVLRMGTRSSAETGPPPQCLLVSGANFCELLLFGLPLHDPFMALFPMPFPNCMLCIQGTLTLLLDFSASLYRAVDSFIQSKSHLVHYLLLIMDSTSSKAFPSCPRYQPCQASSASLLAFNIADLYKICICESVLYTQTPHPVIILTVTSYVLVAQSCLTL